MTDRSLRVAAAAYDIGFFDGWSDYADKLSRWVATAARHDAGLLVFPEYASMELVSLFDPPVRADLSAQLEALQSLAPDVIALHAALAVQHKVYILAASFPIAVAPRHYHNRAHLFAPDGRYDYQDKIQMTRFEREQWLISGGDTLKVFDTAFGRLGINICYDVEFPLLTRQQITAGADLILAPSCTDTRAGYERVRLGCRARALENQCFVVHSSVVGDAAWSPAVDVNVGAAGFYAPVDRGYPDDGILTQGQLNEPGWTFETLDLGALANVRASGQVFNHRDWDGQNGVTLISADL